MKKRKRVQRKYKQMTFDTSVRNPERLMPILKLIKDYNGKVLDDKTVLEIVCLIYLNGVTKSDKVHIDEFSTIDSIKASVIRANKSRNSDGGFPKGYQSRFWTYMRTLSEFGFVYARYNDQFMISKLTLEYFEEKFDEQEIYAIQSIQYNRMSPYRRVSNDYNYFEFLFNILKKLKDNGKNYINHFEFIASTFSYFGDEDEFIDLIENRDFKSKEEVYKYLEDLDPTILTTEYSYKRVISDYPDTILRVLKLNGMISLEYKGMLRILLNDDYIEFYKELFKLKSNIVDSQKEDEISYFEYINNNANIINKSKEYRIEALPPVETNQRLKSYITQSSVTLAEIIDELKKIEKNRDTSNPKFKYFQAPLRLEFLISLLLVSVYNTELEVKPNYKMDSLGAPITTAPGRKGDIDVYTKDNRFWLIEVTTIKSRQQQVNSETTTVVRHLLSENGSYNSRYLSFVAPVIHLDTRAWFDYTIFKHNSLSTDIYIKPSNITDFINVSILKNNLIDIEKYSSNVISSMQIQ
ncbi:MAG: AlwI family type II restriction endonuclease [Tenericutes bacterium]|nr:AlwI family type II restriction endonuclease [Mycoplasmatota bacterium]